MADDTQIWNQYLTELKDSRDTSFFNEDFLVVVNGFIEKMKILLVDDFVYPVAAPDHEESTMSMQWQKESNFLVFDLYSSGLFDWTFTDTGIGYYDEGGADCSIPDLDEIILMWRGK